MFIFYRRWWLYGILMLFFFFTFSDQAFPFEFAKKWNSFPEQGAVQLTNISVTADTGLENEKYLLEEIFKYRFVDSKTGGFPVNLKLASFSFPEIKSSHKNELEKQGYRLTIKKDGIVIQGNSPAGVFYGIQTLLQMMEAKNSVRCGEVIDWPDIPLRMIMVDPARQNETDEYYRRVIRFCARWKISGILCHLTDDQTSCLYHEDYPQLMHEHAWTPERIKSLVEYARKYHVQLIPEIESFGHSRMFVRYPGFKEILHQTKGKSEHSWYGTDVPGYTNVLCPASEKTYKYLEKMYQRAAETFDTPWIHIGCDEVDMTDCERCNKKFPGISKEEWFQKHLLRCHELVRKQGKKSLLWGDMLLKFPGIADGLPEDEMMIFDWHYYPDVTEEPAMFFREKGFDVTACPALVCAPHMNRPDEDNFLNIRLFTKIARENDLTGVCTTVWCPQRYMSDVLWPGLAYASSQAWSGSDFDEDAFYSLFMDDFFKGYNQGEEFQSAWTDFMKIKWRRKDFYTACWMDEDSLREAKEKAEKDAPVIKSDRDKLEEISKELKSLDFSIMKNKEAWETMKRSVDVHIYTLDHLLAAPEIVPGNQKSEEIVRSLDERCIEAIGWIEEDWDRNRCPEDPNKDGLYLDNQHLLYRFRKMHDFHRNLLIFKEL